MTNFDMDKFTFFGTTTVGPKGQMVIPAEARAALGIETGDKMFVFGKGDKVLGVCPAKQAEALLNHLSAHMQGLRDVLQETIKNEGKDK